MSRTYRLKTTRSAPTCGASTSRSAGTGRTSSFAPSEFDITEYVTIGENSVAVEVYRWSTGSYLEDQDFWSLSGIQRNVDLYARPTARVRDFFVHADLTDDFRDGDLRVDIELVGSGDAAENRTLSLALLDADSVVYPA